MQQIKIKIYYKKYSHNDTIIHDIYYVAFI